MSRNHRQADIDGASVIPGLNGRAAVSRPGLTLAALLSFLAALAASAQPAGSVSASLTSEEGGRSRVVVVSNPDATRFFLPNAETVNLMVRQGLIRITGRESAAEAWRSLVSTQDVVGVKVYASTAPNVGTRTEVAAAVVETLLEAGLPATNIVIWDRDLAGMAASGYLELGRRFGVRVTSAQQAEYDREIFYEHSVLGKPIYGDAEFGETGEGVGRKSYVTRLLTGDVTKVVCLSPLLNHNQAGVCGSLYTMAMGSVDNAIRFESEAGLLAEAVPEIYAMPEVGDRVVLNLVDALVCQYRGEQRGLLHYATALNELRFSRDPVALDWLSVQELSNRRDASGLEGVKQGTNSVALLKNASILQLGTINPQEILVER